MTSERYVQFFVVVAVQWCMNEIVQQCAATRIVAQSLDWLQGGARITECQQK